MDTPLEEVTEPFSNEPALSPPASSPLVLAETEWPTPEPHPTGIDSSTFQTIVDSERLPDKTVHRRDHISIVDLGAEEWPEPEALTVSRNGFTKETLNDDLLTKLRAAGKPDNYVKRRDFGDWQPTPKAVLALITFTQIVFIMFTVYKLFNLNVTAKLAIDRQLVPATYTQWDKWAYTPGGAAAAWSLLGIIFILFQINIMLGLVRGISISRTIVIVTSAGWLLYTISHIYHIFNLTGLTFNIQNSFNNNIIFASTLLFLAVLQCALSATGSLRNWARRIPQTPV